MIALFLALAAPTPLEHLKSLSRYPEAVEFRNVREGNGVTCGEINRPWNGRMGGFLPFAYQDSRNNVELTPDGYSVSLPGTHGSSYRFRARIERAQNRNDEIGVRVERERLAEFETRARDFLSRCPSA